MRWGLTGAGGVFRVGRGARRVVRLAGAAKVPQLGETRRRCGVSGGGVGCRLAADGEEELDTPTGCRRRRVGRSVRSLPDRRLRVLEHVRDDRGRPRRRSAANHVNFSVRARIGQLVPITSAAPGSGPTLARAWHNLPPRRSERANGVDRPDRSASGSADAVRRRDRASNLLTPSCPGALRPTSVLSTWSAGLGSGMTGTSRQPPGPLLSVIGPTLGVGKCIAKTIVDPPSPR